MKKLLIVSTILLFSFSAWSQLFEIEQDLRFRRADSSLYEMALVGGMNQPQFSNMDINGDGRLDLFVFDRSGDKVLCLISDLDTSTGKISYFYDPKYDEMFPHMTQFMLLEDYNNDNKPDLWAYNPNAFTPRPQLFKNVSGSEIAFQYVKDLKGYNFDRPPFDTSLFVHWAGTLPDVVDLNGDGDVDYVSNTAPCGSNLTYYLNNTIERNISLDSIDFEVADYCLGNLAEENLSVVLNAKCDYSKNYRYKKHCGTKTLGFFDNDGDGDMDLFFGTSEQLSNPLYFIENGKADLGMSTDTFISIDTTYFSASIKAQIPLAPTISMVDVDLDGVKDLILSTNEVSVGDYTVPQTQNVLYFHNTGTNDLPDFSFEQNDLFVGEMIDFGAYTAPQFVDMDGDGDQDLVVATNGDHAKTANRTHYMVYFENVGIKAFPEYILRDMDFLQLKKDSLRQFVPAFADIDGDSDPDMFLGMMDGSIHFYENTTSGFQLVDTKYADIQVGERAAPCVKDLDGDSILDLLVGCYAGNIFYYRNTGTVTSPSFQLQQDTLGGILLNELIKVTKIGPNGVYDTLIHHFFGSSSVSIGWSNDDKRSLFATGDEGVLRVFNIPSNLNDSFPEVHNLLAHDIKQNLYSKDVGSDAVVASADINRDGYDDVMLGNNRGGLTLFMGRNNVHVNEYRRKRTVGIYPNPNSGEIMLRLDGAGRYEYRIYDLSGRVLQEGTQMSSDALQVNEDIRNGIYLIEVKDDKLEYQPQKFILNR